MVTRPAWVGSICLGAGAAACLLGCASGAAIPPTYTQDELKAECDRHRGWWRPDGLRGGYCDFRGP